MLGVARKFLPSFMVISSLAVFGCNHASGGGSGPSQPAPTPSNASPNQKTPDNAPPAAPKAPVTTNTPTTTKAPDSPSPAAPAKSPDGGAPAPVDAGKPSKIPDPAPDAGPTKVPAAADYSPVGGDQYTLGVKSKAWASGAAEPDFTTGADTTVKVLALYNAGLRCKYRVTTSTGAVTIASDVGCPVSECAVSNCSSKDIDPTDVGNFKAATGTETTCTEVLTIGAGKSLVKMTTQSWSHKDALREARVVKTASTTCTLALNTGEDAATLDACSPPAGRTAQLSRTESSIKDQAAGSGTPALAGAENFAFSASGDFAEPAGAEVSTIRCQNVGGKFMVSMSKTACDANHQLQSYSLSLTGLDAASTAAQSSRAYGAIFAAGGTSYLAKTAGTCSTTLSKSSDGAFLSGNVDCSTGSLSTSTGKAETLSGVSFSCFAP